LILADVRKYGERIYQVTFVLQTRYLSQTKKLKPQRRLDKTISFVSIKPDPLKNVSRVCGNKQVKHMNKKPLFIKLDNSEAENTCFFGRKLPSQKNSTR